MNTLLLWSLQPDFILGYWLNCISIKKMQAFLLDSIHVLLQYSYLLPFEVWPAAYTILDNKRCPLLPS
jgi:hypothetical protein